MALVRYCCTLLAYFECFIILHYFRDWNTYELKMCSVYFPCSLNSEKLKALYCSNCVGGCTICVQSCLIYNRIYVHTFLFTRTLNSKYFWNLLKFITNNVFSLSFMARKRNNNNQTPTKKSSTTMLRVEWSHQMNEPTNEHMKKKTFQVGEKKSIKNVSVLNLLPFRQTLVCLVVLYRRIYYRISTDRYKTRYIFAWIFLLNDTI